MSVLIPEDRLDFSKIDLGVDYTFVMPWEERIIGQFRNWLPGVYYYILNDDRGGGVVSAYPRPGQQIRIEQ